MVLKTGVERWMAPRRITEQKASPRDGNNWVLGKRGLPCWRLSPRLL